MNILKWLTSRKYRFFYRIVLAVQYSMWDLDFKISKSRQVREGVRQDRDRAIENLNHLETALKNPEIAKEMKERMEEDQKAHAENVARYERQMKMIDDEITGVKAEGDNPGQQGMLETLESYAELKGMYKQFLTTI